MTSPAADQSVACGPFSLKFSAENFLAFYSKSKAQSVEELSRRIAGLDPVVISLGLSYAGRKNSKRAQESVFNPSNTMVEDHFFDITAVQTALKMIDASGLSLDAIAAGLLDCVFRFAYGVTLQERLAQNEQREQELLKASLAFSVDGDAPDSGETAQ
jgi:hypothetical protein